MTLANYKNATTAENWDTVKVKGRDRIRFSTWNPCVMSTSGRSIGYGAGQNFQAAFSGMEGYIQDYWRDEKTGILYVTVEMDDTSIKKFKCLNSKRYANEKYIKNRNRVDL